MTRDCSNCYFQADTNDVSCILECIKPSHEPQTYPKWQPDYTTLHTAIQRFSDHDTCQEYRDSVRELVEMVPRTPGKCTTVSSFF